MITSNEAAVAGEKALIQYAAVCGTNTPDDIRKAFEMLISNAARGIEKYCGNQVAIDVLARTIERLATVPAKTKGQK